MIASSAVAKLGVLSALLLLASQAKADPTRRTADNLAGFGGMMPSGTSQAAPAALARKSFYDHGEPDATKRAGATMVNSALGYVTFGIYTAINKAMMAMGAPDGGVMTMDNAQNDGQAISDSLHAGTDLQAAQQNPLKVDVVHNLNSSVVDNVSKNVSAVFSSFGF